MFRTQSSRRATSRFPLFVIPLVLQAVPAVGFELELEDPENFVIKQIWTDDDLGIEGPEGLFFNRGGDVIYVHSRELRPRDSALYSYDVVRDPATNEIVSLENPQLVYNGKFREQPSSGWAHGPEGTLFYTYGLTPFLGQLSGGLQAPRVIDGSEESFFSLQQNGLPNPRAAGVAFSPYITDPNTTFGMLQLSDWSWWEHRIWNQPLEPLGDGYFKPLEAQVLATFPGATGENGSTPSVAGDIAYIPSGPHQGDLLVADWNGGEINILTIDKETGLAIDRATSLPTLATTDPEFVRFAEVEKTWTAVNAIGPYGLEFDPLTNDLFVSMANSNGGPPVNTIIQIGGFPPPPGVVLLEPGDADMDLKFDQ